MNPWLLVPVVAYTLALDPARPDVAEVSIALRGAPTTFHLAMKVHAEYDAQYWRYLDALRVDGGTVAREDSTLWRVTLPGGSGTVRYRVPIQPAGPGLRDAWRPYATADGALVNPPDFFLYVPELAANPATLDLHVPAPWRVATALPEDGAPGRRRAPDAATLLDSPLLLGTFRAWSFADRGTTFHVAYRPLPEAEPFDTARFVDSVRRLAHAALDVFGAAPARDYWFLVEDGAGDALEHAASVVLGVPSATLARDPLGATQEIAHEFFHAWNLVAIRPAGYNELSWRRPARTPSLWIGEGITLHYADVLARRAGIADTTRTRLDHLAALLERYYGSPATRSVSPERASLAFGDAYADNPDATGGYYLQGELLAHVLDALVRDSTRDRRGLDDVMRAMFRRAQSLGGRGYTPNDFERAADSVCGCRLDVFFARQVRGTGGGPIDVGPAVARLGLRLVVDTMPSVDAQGRRVPDLRVSADFSRPGVARLVISNPASMWAAAGLRTGDELLGIDGAPVPSFTDFRRAINRLVPADVGARTVVVDVRRGVTAMQVRVPVIGFDRPRVRFVDVPDVTDEQRTRRGRWLAGAA